MTNITRDSHYVSQAYLRRWGDDRHEIWAYRTLVPDARFPEWQKKAIRGVAFVRDLYTTIEKDKETDEFEKWISREHEEPGLEAIARVAEGQKLRPRDWERLIRYAFIQDRRTPASFVESMERLDRQIPEVFEHVMQSLPGRLEVARGHAAATSTPVADPIGECIKIRIRPALEDGQAEVGAEVIAGRKMWQAQMRHALRPEGVLKRCYEHRWSLAEAADGADWITTDHPVIRLNYYEKGRYDFKGGWGNPRGELILPLTPRYLMYAMIGEKRPSRFTFSTEHTDTVQKCLAERADRWIFSTQQTDAVASLRERMVDAALFTQQEELWRKWSEEQRRAEEAWGDEKQS